MILRLVLWSMGATRGIAEAALAVYAAPGERATANRRAVSSQLGDLLRRHMLIIQREAYDEMKSTVGPGAICDAETRRLLIRHYEGLTATAGWTANVNESITDDTYRHLVIGEGLIVPRRLSSLTEFEHKGTANPQARLDETRVAQTDPLWRLDNSDDRWAFPGPALYDRIAVAGGFTRVTERMLTGAREVLQVLQPEHCGVAQ